MARTATDIANMACDFMDRDPIGSLEADNGQVRLLRRHYEESVETVISEFAWDATVTRAVLPQFSLPDGFTVDATDHQTAWVLPANCVSVVGINGRPLNDLTYAVESIANLDGNGVEVSSRQVLWCDEESVVLRYSRIIDAASMDAHLAKAIAIEMAIRGVMKSANSTQKLEQLRSLYTEATMGSNGRIGGFQVSGRNSRPKPPVARMSISERARMGVV